MAVTTDLRHARDAFAQRRWTDAHATLHAADAERGLDPEDLERLGTAAHLLGRHVEGETVLERAHDAFAAAGRVADAARCGFWLVMLLAEQGHGARANGWLGRLDRLADGEAGLAAAYVNLPRALHELESGDAETAHDRFREAGDLAAGTDPDVAALSRLGMGQALVARGELTAGITLLDEAMVAVHARTTSAMAAGIVYCAVLEVCHAVSDLARAREWTRSLSDWCAEQPDLVPFRGQCLVHRSEVLELEGSWQEALTEADRACRLLSAPPGHAAVGAAHYRRGELHRLRGDLESAEDAYRQASRAGHPIQPGLALLRLAQGETDAAVTALRVALDSATSAATVVELLPAMVRAALADGDPASARRAAQRLEAMVDQPHSRLAATAAQALGAVLLAEGETTAALRRLREAGATWRELDVPYEVARTEELIGTARRRLGDAEGARLAWDAARAELDHLGARPDADRVRRLLAGEATDAPDGLTGREIEVLRLVARGHSNQAIATRLVISRHTVARHLQNIFAKIGVSSRTAAATYAHEHDLV